ncbi:MAG: selenocysteine-specific translation elongation factor [Planctomycetes bacterium]|nr:selenocysteine-specific translation elongation factor [Planctomycetota bacterium]
MAADLIYSIVIGTAGPIDQGKSSLVRQLTGIDPDRLPEEQDRGLTIDLGFAPLVLSTGERVGIIDVPGHERFVKNMVAGATGIDLVMLVVAADDSVMPQTREHIDIMTLLGIQRGIVVINKIDLVEPALVDLVVEEVTEMTRGTFLESAEVYRLSAATGAGLTEFRVGLEKAIRAVPPRREEGVFRMPVQRVFSARGHGTVITGIPVSGGVSVGDRIELLPLGREGRVRGVQAYKLHVEHARAGHSTALNLSDIDYREAHRGMVAATPGYFRATQMIEATVRVLGHLRQPVRHQMPVRFHTGTAEVIGKVYLLEDKTLGPGEEGFAQFRFDEPVVVAPGDRYVFRQESPMLTLGGGEVLDRSAWRLKMGREYVLRALERKHAALGSKEEFVLSIAQESPFQLVESKELAHRTGLPLEEVKKTLGDLEGRGALVPAGQGRGWFGSEGLALGEKRLFAALDACFRRDPYRVHVPRLEARDAAHLEDEFFEALTQFLDQHGKLHVIRGGRLSLPGRRVALKPDEQACYDTVVARFKKDLFQPPRLADLAAESGKAEALFEKVQALLIDEEILLRISPEVIVHRDALDEGIVRLRKLFEAEGAFSASQARVALDTTRKLIIPVLEHYDRVKLTRRIGDLREVETRATG